MSDKVLVDMTEELEALRKLFSRFAVPDLRLSSNAKHNVDLFIGKNNKAGKVRFRFFTRENLGIELTIDCNELIKDPKGYMDETMRSLLTAMGETLERRQQLTKIVLN